MSWTKRQFIAEAYAEIGLADYVYDLDPRQLESAMRRMDSMIAAWNAKGIRISYPIPSSPENSDLDAETNVPDSANQAIFIGLAIQLASGFGKTVSEISKQNFRDAYQGLLIAASKPSEMQYPSTLPLGAGNKNWSVEDEEFFPTPIESLDVGDDGELEFE